MSAASVPCDVTRCDIADRDDITGLVAEFYRRAFADEVLGPIFLDVARVDLPEERHAGPRAELAKTQAARIAGSIHRRVSGEHASNQLRHPDQEPS